MDRPINHLGLLYLMRDIVTVWI